MSSAALLEIGVEDIPASYFESILADLEGCAREELQTGRLDFEQIKCWAAPRRLAVVVSGLAEQQRPQRREIKGPPRQTAFDAQGKPTSAALGFARAQGVPVETLEVHAEDKGEYVYAVLIEEGRPTREVLSEVWERLIRRLSFPKSMRWGEGKMRFVRPIRWLVALLEEEVVPLQINGICSGRFSQGHRTLAPAPAQIRRPGQYLEALRGAQVLVDQQERLQSVQRQASELAASLDAEPYGPDRLAEQIAYMTEHPQAFLGSFAEEFLSLPTPVLVTAMRKHQWYFALVTSGRLLPHFIGFRDGDEHALDNVRRGNERALRGRLADAAFFYQEDRSRTLRDLLPRLDKIAFGPGLGSMLDKAERLRSLAQALAALAGLPEGGQRTCADAAYLCKADLVSRVVVEFPSLQGIMGEQYARLSGEPEEVAVAIGEHYRPASAEESPPQTPVGAIVALADRADTLCAFFAMGLSPTGSEDPYGLRRAAHGVAATLIGGVVRTRVGALLALAIEVLREQAGLECEPAAVREQVADLVRSRAEFLLEQRGFEQEIVEAALGGQWDDLALAAWRAQALSALRSADLLPELALAATRVINILRSREAEAVNAELEMMQANPELFTSEAERVLHAACVAVKEGLLHSEQPERVYEALRPLLAPVHRFFDEVLVMEPEMPLRLNRLALLRLVAARFGRLGDLSRIRT